MTDNVSLKVISASVMWPRRTEPRYIHILVKEFSFVICKLNGLSAFTKYSIIYYSL